ncbi:MAG: antitoxin VapB family protein [Candidatus Hydrothermarchaeaceae archaeon]
MSVKTITIKDDIYKVLSSMKREGESFSDLLRRLTSRKVDITEFYGILSESNAVLEEMKKEILEERKRSVLRDVHL